MGLSVIGAGFPRTGTSSLKTALNELGFGPCYHMSEVFTRPDHWPMWEDAAAKRPVDWDKLFEGYHSAVDAPSSLFYRELAGHYPDAKIILTTRDPERWFESTQATVLAPAAAVRIAARPPEFLAMMRAIGWHAGDPESHDKDTMIGKLLAHNEEVRRTIAPARLLDWEAAQGWEPLCAFLGVPVPDTPFPRINTTEQFQKMMSGGGAAFDPELIKRTHAEQAERQRSGKT
jgi:hypothetical protein